jgi:hypothetical protein
LPELKFDFDFCLLFLSFLILLLSCFFNSWVFSIMSYCCLLLDW